MFTAQDLAHAVESHHGLDPLVADVIYDATSTSGPHYRPLTAHELKVAKRYIRRAERQSAYLERKAEIAAKHKRAIERAERAAHDENRARNARCAVELIAAASRQHDHAMLAAHVANFPS
jgi:hypothetical protein